MNNIRIKANSRGNIFNLPVNQKIIGKNVNITMKERVKTNNYEVALWVHKTYALPNKPYGMGNFSLPDDEFSFASTKEPNTAKYFLKCAEQAFEEP